MKTSIFFLLFTSLSLSQTNVVATPADKVQKSIVAKQALAKKSLLKNLPLVNIGPSIMSGRVTDIDVNPNRTHEFYVSYASGGLWYTKNNGISFDPVMDSSPTQNIGDIAVDWKNGTLWVGTGENNSSRSSYAGIGILKSENQGKTWENMGLTDSHHIGGILINPDNPNEVIVGALGHLYSPNQERGIFKTMDGGKTWNKTLYIDEVTGIIDIAHVPGNYNIMFAAAWQKDRKAWHFEGSGNKSGIYKSIDAGMTWEKITTAESGFPQGEGVGRIGLAVFDENTVYVVLDNQAHRPKKNEEIKKSQELNKDDFKTMANSNLLKLDDKKLDQFLRKNDFPEKYKAEGLKDLVRSGSIQARDLYAYLSDANSQLFDTPVIGAEVYRSTDGGQHWQKQNQDYIDGLYYSYGYYFGEIRVNAQDPNTIYLGGVPLLTSMDGGKSFSGINGDNVHADHQALWVNPKIDGHLINGNDGGLNMSYDNGTHWNKLNSPTVGQFYAIQIDTQDPYHVYGGLQDNGVWEGPYNAKENSRWHASGKYPWSRILGGDGMQVAVDTRNPDLVYTGFQFGNYFKIDRAIGKRKHITPKHDIGEEAFRFNWQTPIALSKHNQDVLYLGSNKLHRSLNQGTTWEIISHDLTQGAKQGNVAFGTITTLSESPFRFGLLYTGSDDGVVQVSKDAGSSWQNITGSLPKNLWVSRVLASSHKKERIYVTLNGYRWDNFNPYVYVSEDYGKTWKSIANNLPVSPINVIVEDPENENLLFAGSDEGLYASLDRGNTWHVFQKNMPNVAVHDLKINPAYSHLLVGTHGRSIYRANIAQLQQLNPSILAKNLHLFQLENLKYSMNWGNSFSVWSKPNTPGLDIVFYSKLGGEITAFIKSGDGTVVSKAEANADAGLNFLAYDVAFSKSGKNAYLKKNKTELKEANNGKTYLPKGVYTVVLKGKEKEQTTTFKIE